MRLDQLIANLGTLAKGPTVEVIWDVEDEELLEAARRQLEIFRALLGVDLLTPPNAQTVGLQIPPGVQTPGYHRRPPCQPP